MEASGSSTGSGDLQVCIWKNSSLTKIPFFLTFINVYRAKVFLVCT